MPILLEGAAAELRSLGGPAAYQHIAEQGRRVARRLHLLLRLALFIMSIVVLIRIAALHESYLGCW